MLATVALAHKTDMLHCLSVTVMVVTLFRCHAEWSSRCFVFTLFRVVSLAVLLHRTTGADWLWTADAAHHVLAYGGRLSGVCPQPWGFPSPVHSTVGPQLDPGSFTTMLSALMTARTAASAAHSLWDLSGELEQYMQWGQAPPGCALMHMLAVCAESMCMHASSHNKNLVSSGLDHH